jgi:membrane protein DedA with SNARE-associated domain
MTRILEFLLRHGYLVVFGSVAVEQVGVPVPSVPVLLAMGALAAQGRFSFAVALLVATLGSLPGDWIWYELGRVRGYGVLRVICRISLEAEVCVQRTETIFERYGVWALVLAKFLPGFSTVAPPLAGMLKMSRWRFLALDGAGAALWAFAYLYTGYLFHRELYFVAELLSHLGSWVVAALAAPLVAWVLWKYIRWRRFLKEIRHARIGPAEALRRLQSDHPPVVLDLRYAWEYERSGKKIPGAIHVPAEQLHWRHHEIPRDRDLLLYCT